MANEFYALMGRMRNITRWSLMRNTFSENIQEHSHQVAMLDDVQLTQLGSGDDVAVKNGDFHVYILL